MDRGTLAEITPDVDCELLVNLLDNPIDRAPATPFITRFSGGMTHVASSDTHVGNVDWNVDWNVGDFQAGTEQRVRIRQGQLQGVEGVLVSRADAGRVLVRLQTGVFVQLDSNCLEVSDQAP